MNKFKFAATHGLASIFGWIRLFCSKPRFAAALLSRRWRYFCNRRYTDHLTTPDGFRLDTPDSLITYWSMFVENELYDSRWVRALRNASAPLVVDVGANVGLFSHMAYTINPKARIVAFEPLPALRDRLQALPGQTGIKLEVRSKAAGRAPGKAVLESPQGYDGVSRICTTGQPKGQTFEVEVTTLDRELAGCEVLVMKIDVEGFECEVIAGATNVLASTKFVVIEAQTAEHLSNVTAALGHGWNRRKLGASDYLFCRAS
jgi:FkbM family methyltransferase